MDGLFKKDSVWTAEEFVDKLRGLSNSQVAQLLPLSLRQPDSTAADLDGVKALGTLLNAMWSLLLGLPVCEL